MLYQSLIAAVCFYALAAGAQSTNIYAGQKIVAGTTQFTTTVSAGGGGGGGDYTTGLALWLKLNDGSGTTAADSSGNSYTGTFTYGFGAGSWQTGCYQFNSFGSQGPLQVGDEAALDPSSAITIEFFFNSTQDNNGSSAPGGFLGRGYGAGYNLIGAGNASDVAASIWVNGAQTTLTTSGAGFFDGSWHQVAITWDGSTDGKIRIYKDGSLIATSATGVTGSITGAAGAPLTIGSFNNDNQNNLFAEVKHFRIYGAGLTGAQVGNTYTYLSTH